MGLRDALLGGAIGFVTGGPVGAGMGALSGYMGGEQRDAAEEAASRAQGLSDQQIAMLKRILGIQTQYGDPLLAKAYSLIGPTESAWQRSQYSRGVEDINKQFRPAYGQELQSLSSRKMLSEPNSYAPSMVSAMDRARGGAIASYTGNWRANRAQEEWNNLAKFSDLLGQQTGAGTSVAGAFQQPINTYANLATQAGSGQYDALAALLKWYQLQQMQKLGGSGPYLGDPMATSTMGPITQGY